MYKLLKITIKGLICHIFYSLFKFLGKKITGKTQRHLYEYGKKTGYIQREKREENGKCRIERRKIHFMKVRVRRDGEIWMVAER